MKRVGNLFEKIVSLENLIAADKAARKGKKFQKGVVKHVANEESNILNLRETLLAGDYKTSKYTTFKIFDGKEREISKLPYFPDRIVHHAIVRVIEPILVASFTHDTYSCIKGRGIHKASYNLRRALKDIEGTKYCLKLDIQKFYPSIDNNILKELLRHKFKDRRLLELLNEIIDSAKGLPIGSYLSQYLANFYLNYFDHHMKEVLMLKYYFRYADDVVILSSSKDYLREVLKNIEQELTKLNLKIKTNYQIFPVSSRGIDWVGYVHYQTHTLLRKKIKLNYIKSKNRFNYNGWLIHANTINLRRKYETS